MLVFWFDPKNPVKTSEIRRISETRTRRVGARLDVVESHASGDAVAEFRHGQTTVNTAKGYDLVITKVNGVSRLKGALGQAANQQPAATAASRQFFNTQKPSRDFFHRH